MPLSANQLSISALVLLVVTVWILCTQPRPSAGISGSDEWHQPEQLNLVYPVPISPQAWPFDFEPVAKLLAKLQLDASGELLVNANTADTLQQITLAMTLALNDDELQRYVFLAAQELPGKAGQQLAELLLSYYHFKRAEQAAQLTLPNTADAAALLAKEQRITELKQRYLGRDTAYRLFGRRDALTLYLLARREVNENPGLTSTQRRQALKRLQAQFEQQQLKHNKPQP